MPLYEYQCPACNRLTESLQRPHVAAVVCPCGAEAPRILSRPAAVAPELTPYYDTGLGQRIESRAQRRAAMREQGLVEKGTTHLHGAKGTIFSHPGQAATSVPKSGAYARG